jgi:hypothetical protein
MKAKTMKTKAPTIIAATLRLSVAAALLVAGAALALPTAAHARSHTFFGLSLVVPVGPPAYAPPPYYYAPAYYYPPPVVVAPQAAPCQQGLWRQSDGSVVRGLACLSADGNWRLAN